MHSSINPYTKADKYTCTCTYAKLIRKDSWISRAHIKMAPYIAPEVSPRMGFWGEATAGMDWCEENYVVSDYVAEFCTFVVCVHVLCCLGYRFVVCFLVPWFLTVCVNVQFRTIYVHLNDASIDIQPINVNFLTYIIDAMRTHANADAQRVCWTLAS